MPIGSETLKKDVNERVFSWSTSDEPHATRRKLILAKYPQMAKLFGVEPLTCPIVLTIFAVQMSLAYYCTTASWVELVVLAYVVGGTLNHSLQLAVHELSHNLCFHNPAFNKILAIFANLVTGFPSSATFQRYHMDHHQFQGVDGIDTDIPTQSEVNYFVNTLHKLLWVILQPAFYALRPLVVKPKPPTFWEFVNWGVQYSFNFLIFWFLGYKAIAYLVMGTLLGLGLHPSAGHFIAEHYEFVRGVETYSYYGPWNYANFNVGYHNEHHDFPKIPWSRISKVREIAPEFYRDLPSYDSYVSVMYRYITDPTVGPHSRIKRPQSSAAQKVDASLNLKAKSAAMGGKQTLIFGLGALTILGAVASFY